MTVFSIPSTEVLHWEGRPEDSIFPFMPLLAPLELWWPLRFPWVRGKPTDLDRVAQEGKGVTFMESTGLDTLGNAAAFYLPSMSLFLPHCRRRDVIGQKI